MGNIQANSNENRAVAKTKRSLRIKTRTFSRLMSSNSRRHTPRNELNYVTSGTDNVDEADTEFSNVIFTKIPNQRALELDHSIDDGDDGGLQDKILVHASDRSTESSPKPSYMGKKLFVYFFCMF